MFKGWCVRQKCRSWYQNESRKDRERYKNVFSTNERTFHHESPRQTFIAAQERKLGISFKQARKKLRIALQVDFCCWIEEKVSRKNFVIIFSVVERTRCGSKHNLAYLLQHSFSMYFYFSNFSFILHSHLTIFNRFVIDIEGFFWPGSNFEMIISHKKCKQSHKNILKSWFSMMVAFFRLMMEIFSGVKTTWSLG